MIAALVIFAVFIGISLVIATVAGTILIAHGRITLPGTNMRKVQEARVQLELAKINLERESYAMRLDDAIKLRTDRMLDPSSREPTSAEASVWERT